MGWDYLLSEGQRWWKLLLALFILLDTLIVCFFLLVIWSGETPAATPEPTPAEMVIAVTLLPTTPPTPSRTPTPGRPTSTATRVVRSSSHSPTPTPASNASTARPNQEPANVLAHLKKLANSRSGSVARPVSFTRRMPLVLAHYFAWYDGDGWQDCNISAGDRPLEPYHSDDPVAIARHVEMARAIGLNGFTLHWFAPGDRTDQNFRSLLTASQGTRFASTVVFSHHIWHGLTQPRRANITEALRYIIEQHTPHPNFLRVEGKPVIFFTDIYRTPEASPHQFWASLRDEVDPERQTLWIGEGLDASYLSVFDGLYVFKISHAAYPHDYRKSARWGGQVRRWADQTGQPKLWIATISPGWDDLRAGCRADVRVDNQPHRLERAGGAIYEATLQSALESNPDWLIVSSFNEWVEGSYIEPSEQYGRKYLELTAEFVTRFKEDE